MSFEVSSLYPLFLSTLTQTHNLFDSSRDTLQAVGRNLFFTSFYTRFHGRVHAKFHRFVFPSRFHFPRFCPGSKLFSRITTASRATNFPVRFLFSCCIPVSWPFYFDRNPEVDHRTEPIKVENLTEDGGLSVLMEPFLDDYFYSILPTTGWKVIYGQNYGSLITYFLIL